MHVYTFRLRNGITLTIAGRSVADAQRRAWDQGWITYGLAG